MRRGGKYFGGFGGVERIGLLIILSQAAVMLLSGLSEFSVQSLQLRPAKVLEGEYWRLLTFLVIPPYPGLSIWNILWWLLLFIYTDAVEAAWGALRLNAFLLLGWLGTLAAAAAAFFIYPEHLSELIWIPNTYMLSSIFLAFAFLNPEHRLLLFFVVPVKVKWLAWLVLGFYFLNLIQGGWATRLGIAGGLVNLVVFFGPASLQGLLNFRRKSMWQNQAKTPTHEAFHTCVVCGLTDLQDDRMQFTYHDGKAYCEVHREKISSENSEKP